MTLGEGFLGSAALADILLSCPGAWLAAKVRGLLEAAPWCGWSILPAPWRDGEDFAASARASPAPAPRPRKKIIITRTILDMVVPLMLLLVFWALRRLLPGLPEISGGSGSHFQRILIDHCLRIMIGFLQNSLQEGGQDPGRLERQIIDRFP
jgi:hypothetical protein